MDGLSESARFQALFESALQAYERKTGITMTQYPLVVDLQNCHSIDDITTLLQGRTQTFNDYRERGRMTKAIRTTVSILAPLSQAAVFADAAVGLSFPPAKAIYVGLGILLEAANGVISSCDVLADLLESIERFVKRLQIYIPISRMPVMDDILINLIVTLISTLAWITRKLNQRRSLKFIKNFFGVKDIMEARQRLDRLIQEEVATTAAQILEVVLDQAENVKKFIDDAKALTDVDPIVSNQMTSDVNKSKRDTLLNDIQKWLSPPDPWKNYNIARELRHGETGAWFVNGTTHSKWKDSGMSSLLCIYGKPGSGKSVISSTIIKDIENSRKVGRASLAMYYYDFREEKKKDLRGLLSSILFQLCNQSDSYYNILSTFHSTHSNGSQSPSDDDLVECLKDLLKIPGPLPVYLIIDGLDECPSISSLSSPREKVLSLLEDLIEARFTNLRLCVTSRPEADIKAILSPLTFCSVSLHDENGQKEDIEKYIESIVNTNRNMQDWSLEHKRLVIDTLSKKADGMFQYVRCQLDHLALCLPRDIQKALSELPDTLDGTYERTLRAIDNTRWETARRLLQCVVVASRPLRVDELADVLALDFEAGPIPKYHEDWRVNLPVKAVLSTCSTLLSIVEAWGSQVIQFSHFSVREFLTSTRFAEKCDIISSRYHISTTPAHTLLAQACLGILLHLEENVTRDALIKFSLAEYAAEHWFEHARFEGVPQNAESGMNELFDRRKHHLAVWLWIYNPTVTSWMQNKSAKVPSPPYGTPLHYAAFCDLHEVVKALAIEHPSDVNSGSFYNKSTPLHLVSQEGHVELARLLLEHGANTAAQDQQGWTPLHRASERGHVELARLLLVHGADATAQDQRGWTPLHVASEGGNVELARLLLEHGADAAVQDQGRWTPLHGASERGHIELARLLLEHGADTAAQDQGGWTPLHGVSERGHVELARLLLERGADAAAQDQGRWAPLHSASGRGDVELARLLLEHGADAAAQDQRGWTPLHRASGRGDVELAWLLLEHGADATAQDQGGYTPLHRASERGHVELVRLLLEHGADAAAQDQRGQTPLHVAPEWGDVELAQLLLEHGADVAAKDQEGSTPAHRASEKGSMEPSKYGTTLATNIQSCM